MQRHASFFDENGDRGIGVPECVRGLKAIGIPGGIAEVFALSIVAALSRRTRGSLLALNIDIDRIDQGKHVGDTGVFDGRGRFLAKRFERIFGAHSTVDRNGDKAFTTTELTRLACANRASVAGYVAAVAEWQLLLAVAADTCAIEHGRTVPALSVKRIKAFYDGTLFYTIARERADGVTNGTASLRRPRFRPPSSQRTGRAEA